MSHLRRKLAPVSDAAWREIERQADQALRSSLSARRFVDFDGPHGFGFSGVNLGESFPTRRAEDTALSYGIRRILPLIEVRVAFELELRNLDNLERGADHIEGGAVTKAALSLAEFEENAVYHGFAEAGIRGILSSDDSTAIIKLTADPQQYVDAVAEGIVALSDRGVGGPFSVILGPKCFRSLSGHVGEYPARQRIEKMIAGPVLLSPALNGGLIVSRRGGDFRFTSGEDVTLGFDHHARERATFYLTETFTFNLLGPEAAIELQAPP